MCAAAKSIGNTELENKFAEGTVGIELYNMYFEMDRSSSILYIETLQLMGVIFSVFSFLF
jgi:hypothetical protein